MTKLLQYCALLLAIVLSSLQPASAGTVIANAGVAPGSLSRDHLFALFSMRVSRWPGGEPVTLIVYPDQHPAHARFVKRTLQIYPYQLRSIWDRYIFSGTAQAPVVVESAAQMLERVRRTEGAIGYLEESVRQPEGVDVIAIQ
ncbi:hypothetical protein [Marinobacterium aestuariivivens]|uniref:PBP domain-containing protein n=1 Tax=Marinobacterium aestuariivivens TaxID=1698799 RepID=A0ABW1ZTY1_9GAMM